MTALDDLADYSLPPYGVCLAHVVAAMDEYIDPTAVRELQVSLGQDTKKSVLFHDIRVSSRIEIILAIEVNEDVINRLSKSIGTRIATAFIESGQLAESGLISHTFEAVALQDMTLKHKETKAIIPAFNLIIAQSYLFKLNRGFTSPRTDLITGEINDEPARH